MKTELVQRNDFDVFSFQSIGELERVNSAVSFYLKSTLRVIHRIEFYSSRLGIVSWYRKENRFETKVWEGEERAQSLSALNYHYTGEFLFSSAGEDIVKKILLPVIEEIENFDLKRLIRQQIEEFSEVILSREKLLKFLNQ